MTWNRIRQIVLIGYIRTIIFYEKLIFNYYFACSSDNEDTQMPILTPAPQISIEPRQEPSKETEFRNIQIKPKPATVLSTIPIQQLQNSSSTQHPTIGLKQTSTLPFPLLILNGVGAASGSNIQQSSNKNNNSIQDGNKKTENGNSSLEQQNQASLASKLKPILKSLIKYSNNLILNSKIHHRN